MKIVFLTNFFNHHQKPLSDALYRMLGEGNYLLVETSEFPMERRKLGYQELKAPYVLRHGCYTTETVKHIITSFDVVIYGSAPLSLVKSRYREGKMTFCYSERRYKTISRYFFYPLYSYRSFYLNKGYLLCASAYSSNDYYLSGMPRTKCFKWGYFPVLREYGNINNLIENKQGYKNGTINILWVGRLIDWKRPKDVIKLAHRLMQEGIRFSLHIIGNGELETSIKEQVAYYNLDDNVHVLGGMHPDRVRDFMDLADIFLFTSNRQEGWGAVLNESMNSACAVVVSDAIGSVPYLIKDGQNGLIYRNGNIEDLFNKVSFLIYNHSARINIQKSAYDTVITTWNPQSAACNFINLVKALNRGDTTPILEGPCSQA